MKGEIEGRLKQAKANIQEWKIARVKEETKAAGYEETLGLLKKEGQLRIMRIMCSWKYWFLAVGNYQCTLIFVDE